MSQHDVAENPEGESAAGQKSAESTPVAGELTVDALNRYLAAALEDRDAAEERSANTIARFTRLTIAMMCLTVVVAGVNIAMLLRQPSIVAQPTVVVSPRTEEPPAPVVAPAQPVLPAPSPPPEPPRPAEKIQLLGRPMNQSARPALASPRVVRAVPAQPRSQPLLFARTVEPDSRDPGVAERW